MDIKDIVTLIEAVSKNNLTSLVIEENGTKLSLKREKEREIVTAVPPVAAPAVSAMGLAPGLAGAGVTGLPVTPEASLTGSVSAQAAETKEDIPSGNVVKSPLVGTFYSAPAPDADSFVKVGDTVKKGQVLGIIEAMKLMNEIESEYDGVVEAILVNNEEVVEYGQPLFRIK